MDEDEKCLKSDVPNPLTKEELCVQVKNEKPKLVSLIEEAYDCAKIFNTTVTGNQMPIGVLCDTYLNLVFKRGSGPGFAVSFI